jgi:hypothetical protein
MLVIGVLWKHRSGAFRRTARQPLSQADEA